MSTRGSDGSYRRQNLFITRRLAGKSPLAIRLAKDATRNGLSMSLADSIEYEKNMYAISHGSEDKQEGIATFLEKRKANFQGR